MTARRDITPDFRWSASDARLLRRLLKHEGTPRAIAVFDEIAPGLSSSAYWFTLGTLWVSYTGWSNLDRWRRLFSSDRIHRETSLMKPSELRLYEAMPDEILAYRAHRPGEKDWIAYTLDPNVAARFGVERNIPEAGLYRIAKADVLALFTRRGEAEILVLDREKAVFVRNVPVQRETEAAP